MFAIGSTTLAAPAAHAGTVVPTTIALTAGGQRRRRAGELLVGDEQHVAAAQRRQRIVGAREAEQLGAVRVGGAIGAQREVLDAGKGRFLPDRDAERAAPAASS